MIYTKLSYLLPLIFFMDYSEGQKCPDKDIKAEEIDLSKITGDYKLIGVLFSNSTTTDANDKSGTYEEHIDCDQIINFEADGSNTLKMTSDNSTELIIFPNLPDGNGINNPNSKMPIPMKVLEFTDTSMILSFCMKMDSDFSFLFFLRKQGSAIDAMSYPDDLKKIITKNYYKVMLSVNYCSDKEVESNSVSKED